MTLFCYHLLRCDADPPDDVVEYIWFNDGNVTERSATNRYEISNFKLTLSVLNLGIIMSTPSTSCISLCSDYTVSTAIQSSDGGVYSCRAVTSCGTEVDSPPVTITSKQSRTVKMQNCLVSAFFFLQLHPLLWTLWVAAELK